jgi:ABC-type phosphate/phosphonate transport system substrate-binding protein
VIASLPMYDRPENSAAHDALWALIRDGLRERNVAAPDALDRKTDYVAGWAAPDLLLSQICNLPYRARFRDTVNLIGAADYGLPGITPGYYCSVILVRADDPARCATDCAGYRMAYSDPLSHSGWGSAFLWAQPEGLTLSPVLKTGAHSVSLQALVEGDADLVSVDIVSWMNLARWDRLAGGARVLAQTPQSPGMTFVTGRQNDPEPLFEAIAAAIAALPQADRDLLGLRGIVRLGAGDYDIPLPPDPEHLPN